MRVRSVVVVDSVVVGSDSALERLLLHLFTSFGEESEDVPVVVVGALDDGDVTGIGVEYQPGVG